MSKLDEMKLERDLDRERKETTRLRDALLAKQREVRQLQGKVNELEHLLSESWSLPKNVRRYLQEHKLRITGLGEQLSNYVHGEWKPKHKTKQKGN